ncbi:MAG: EamA family transporter, partial [Pseudomonadota bacterium]|nr:EamA family transporter [Pseudomonadota bacterium]
AIALTPVIFFVDGQLVGPGNTSGWALLILVGGIFGTGGHVFNVLAMHYAGPVRVAPFFFFSIIWMIIFQTLFFGGNIDPLTLVGASIVIASGLFVFWREARASRLERGHG